MNSMYVMVMADIKLLIKYIKFCLGAIIVILYYMYEMIIRIYIMKYYAFQHNNYLYYENKYLLTLKSNLFN